MAGSYTAPKGFDPFGGVACTVAEKYGKIRQNSNWVKGRDMPVLMDKTDLAATLESARQYDRVWRRHGMSARDMIGFGKRFRAPQ